MLSREGLIEESGRRGLPAGKLRGAAREYLQALTLQAFFGRKASGGMVFLGGTALRFGFDISRFSEDLNFDADIVSFASWKDLLDETAHELSRYGLQVETRSREKGSLLASDLRFSGFLQSYGLEAESNEKLRVKIEANRPEYALDASPRVLSAYGEMFPVRFASPGLMFAEKILALRAREQGRDIYDLFFMAGRRWAPRLDVLLARGVGSPADAAILERLRHWDEASLSRLAKKLEPFLFDPAQARLVAQAGALLPPALEYLKSP